jgi:hypothetical protein
MTALAFEPDTSSTGHVLALDGPRSYRVDERQAEMLLGLWLELGASRLFNELHTAHVKAGGVSRCSSFRTA